MRSSDASLTSRSAMDFMPEATHGPCTDAVVDAEIEVVGRSDDSTERCCSRTAMCIATFGVRASPPSPVATLDCSVAVEFEL
jgi:hypothetical protein